MVPIVTQRPTIFGRSLKASFISGAICFAVTFFVPLIFYFFFEIMPFSGDTMGKVTRMLWFPSKVLVDAFSWLVSRDLSQYVNGIYLTPFINGLLGALIAFALCYGLLYLRHRRRDNGV